MNSTFLFWFWEISGWCLVILGWYFFLFLPSNLEASVFTVGAVACWAYAASYSNRNRLDELENRIHDLEDENPHTWIKVGEKYGQ